MSCNSAIYSVNTNSQALTAATPATVNFGTVVRRFGPSVDMNGGDIVISASGFYEVDVNLGLTVGDGNVTVQLSKDGTAIPGAVAVVTSAAADTACAISIPFIIRNKCCCDSTLSCVVTSATAGTITNAAIEVKKI